MLFYLLAYAVTNLGAFGVIVLLDNADRPNDRVRDYAGLVARAPGAGRPHDALSAVARRLSAARPGSSRSGTSSAPRSRPGYVWLAIIGVLTSVVAVFFYLRVVVMMYMTPERPSGPLSARAARIAGLALAISAVLVLYLGILPTRVLNWAAASISTIF